MRDDSPDESPDPDSPDELDADLRYFGEYLDALEQRWAYACPVHDAKLPPVAKCCCPGTDPRQVILRLARQLRTARKERDTQAQQLRELADERHERIVADQQREDLGTSYTRQAALTQKYYRKYRQWQQAAEAAAGVAPDDEHPANVFIRLINNLGGQASMALLLLRDRGSGTQGPTDLKGLEPRDKWPDDCLQTAAEVRAKFTDEGRCGWCGYPPDAHEGPSGVEGTVVEPPLQADACEWTDLGVFAEGASTAEEPIRATEDWQHIGWVDRR